VSEGKTATDAHHIAGKANDPMTISIPINDHVAILTERQREWPDDTLKNPDRDPFLKFAARIRGVADTIRYLFEQLLLGAARAFEVASVYLTALRGRFWWRGTPLEVFAK
jgi:hypothetical protein